MDDLITELKALADRFDEGAGAGQGDWFQGKDAGLYSAADSLREVIARHERRTAEEMGQ